MNIRILILTALAAFPLRLCQAAEMPNYIEAGVTSSWMTIDSTLFVETALTVTQKPERGTGFVLRYGRQIVGRWGFEASYFDSGYFKVRGTDSTGAAWSVNIHPMNWTLGGTAAYDVNERLKVTGRFGGVAYENNFGKSALVKRTLPDQDRGVGLYYGLGATFKVASRLQLSTTIDQYNGTEKTTMLSAGLRASF